MDIFQINVPFDFSTLCHNAEFLHRIETIQLIYIENRLTGFYLMITQFRIVKSIKIKESNRLKYRIKN